MLEKLPAPVQSKVENIGLLVPLPFLFPVFLLAFFPIIFLALFVLSFLVLLKQEEM